MISFFPELYPDELIYSAFARYLDKSGYGTYRAAVEDIFEKSLSKPDILFVNKLKSEVIDVLTKQKPWERIVAEHSMFPYFGRFLFQDRRRKAFLSMINMDGKHRDLLQMPKDGNSDILYLKYCPSCCKRDREIYGETYWHREHQMYGINVCAKHKCHLINSRIPLRSSATPGFFSAETSTEEEIPTPYNNNLEIKLAQYITDAFHEEVVDTITPFHLFLHEKVAGSKYTSPRGEHKNVSLFYQDFADYYAELDNNPVQEQWQFKKICDGKTHRMKEICMLAMFIGVPSSELVAMQMPEELHMEAFDRRIRDLHNQGLKYPQIAEIMGASYHLCKTIGNGRYYKYNKGRTINRGGVKSRDWDEYDKKLLPHVKEAITVIYSGKGSRPRRVTINAVAKYIGITAKRFDNLKLCCEEIQNNYESNEEYWAREMVFFYDQLKREGGPIAATALTRMTNAKRKNLEKGVKYLELYTDADTARTIEAVLNAHSCR